MVRWLLSRPMSIPRRSSRIIGFFSSLVSSHRSLVGLLLRKILASKTGLSVNLDEKRHIIFVRRMGETALVTVGSTLFDALICAVDNLEVAQALKERGYSKLVIQLGNGNHLPSTLLPAECGSDGGSGKAENGLLVEWFRFTPTLAKHIETASLVISHAGSASTFESLRAGKTLVSVPNPKLMANHQQELAEELAAQRFCVFSTPADLPKTLTTMDLSCLRPYTGGDPAHVANAINRIICATPERSKRISVQRRYTVSLLGISLFLASTLLTCRWQH